MTYLTLNDFRDSTCQVYYTVEVVFNHGIQDDKWIGRYGYELFLRCKDGKPKLLILLHKYYRSKH